MIKQHAHRDCWDLLPWVANERLSSEDAARIGSHLSGCAACQAELRAQARLREAIRGEQALMLAPQTSLQKLMQRLDAEKPGHETVASASAAAPKAPRQERAHRRSWLAIAVAVQGVAVALLLSAASWRWYQQMLEPSFTTQTVSSAVVVDGPVIRALFAEGVTLHELDELLRSVNAQIVAGPSEAGVYTLAPASGAATDTQIDAAVARLRTDRRVLFAERAEAEVRAR
jgi:hypothetical protein